MGDITIRDAGAVARPALDARLRGLRPRLARWGTRLLARLGVYRVAEPAPPPGWDDAEQW